MKTGTIFRMVLGLLFLPFLTSCLILPPGQVEALDNYSSDQSELYSQEELAQMLAPIALYPDALLSQVLMASTYPTEVVEADRWVRKNRGLRGEDLDAALMDIDWDPSVKAMCHFPSILALMSERISETTNIGNAFLAQEADVMDMVQELRARAYNQNNLTSNSRQKVIVENERIIIEPADPRVIYVSYYNPAYIYGPWWYPAYPPYYWGPPGVRIGSGISYWPGFYSGFAFGTWSYFDWHRHYIHIHADRRPNFVRHERWFENPGRWVHAPEHRRGVVYRDKPTAWKYSQDPQRHRNSQRENLDVPGQWDKDRHRRMDEDQNRQRRMEDQDRQRRDEDRNRNDRRKHLGWDPAEADRDRQDRDRVERERGERERVNRDAQKQQELERERINRDAQKQQALERDKLERDRADREKRLRERAERDLQGRERIELERQERIRNDHERQQQQLREHQERIRIEREQQQKQSDKVINQADDGKKERQTRDHGPGSQRGPGDNSGGKDTGDQEKDERQDRGHNRRW